MSPDTLHTVPSAMAATPHAPEVQVASMHGMPGEEHWLDKPHCTHDPVAALQYRVLPLHVTGASYCPPALQLSTWLPLHAFVPGVQASAGCRHTTKLSMVALAAEKFAPIAKRSPMMFWSLPTPHCTDDTWMPSLKKVVTPPGRRSIRQRPTMLPEYPGPFAPAEPSHSVCVGVMMTW